MSQDKQFLVSGALLECPYGTQKTTLQGMESDASLQIGNELFLSTAFGAGIFTYSFSLLELGE